MSFGGSSWAINSADMVTGQLNNGQCLGSFFELSTGSSAPAWIVGDTFLVSAHTFMFLGRLANGYPEKCVLCVSVQPTFGRLRKVIGQGHST